MSRNFLRWVQRISVAADRAYHQSAVANFLLECVQIVRICQQLRRVEVGCPGIVCASNFDRFKLQFLACFKALVKAPVVKDWIENSQLQILSTFQWWEKSDKKILNWMSLA